MDSAVPTSASSGAQGFDAARRHREPLLDRGRLAAQMEAAGLDALVAASLPNVIYTSCALLGFASAPTYVVTTSSGDQVVVVNDIDAGFIETYSPIELALGYPYGPDASRRAIELLGDALGQLGLERSRVGTEPSQLGPEQARALAERWPSVSWADGTDAFDRTRVVKTPAEIELLRDAAQVTLTAIVDAVRGAGPEPTERGLAAEIQSNALRAGAEGLGHTLVNAGENSTLVHSIAFDRVLRPGEVLHVDFGARFAGYTSDVARNAVLGDPSREQIEVQRRLREAYEATLAWIAPGRTGEEVFRRAVADLERVGLRYAWQSIGHGVGLSLHEGIELAPGAATPLEPGMVICLEPSVVVEGDARYDLEDMLVVTDGGVERLCHGFDGLTGIGA